MAATLESMLYYVCILYLYWTNSRLHMEFALQVGQNSEFHNFQLWEEMLVWK